MKRASLLLGLLVASCASGAPAPINYGGGAERAPETRVPETPRAQPQQPAPNWADGEGTPLSTFALQPGEVQPYDPAHVPRTHRVAADESLYDIATRYQAPLRALIDQNRLEPPYALTPGQVLELPPPRFHTVERGESFEDVARAYNVDLRSLALLNRMQPPYQVRTGDRVVLPALARAREAPPPAPAPGQQQSAAAPAPGAGRFVWPLRGEVVTRFGAQQGGQRSDGIEIAGREGAQVVAAADGEVFYAGGDLPAYGTLILVRHQGEYVTAYAYNRRALVREGQQVRAGQAIAELGGRPSGPARLMFQVRRGSGALDPAPFLGAR
ncbi:MAG: peptidoglycan DD-metalloendopeptidase family protein [Hyphomonadaceae bacterium]